MNHISPQQQLHLNDLESVKDALLLALARVASASQTVVPWPAPQVRPPLLRPVKVTEHLSIDAIKIKSPKQVKADGNLYYIESADHFAFKLNDELFHGNIGTIFCDGRSMEKIKDCKFSTSCSKKGNCDYYHDPFKFPGSKDRRNFVAPKSRKSKLICSLDGIDILDTTKEEASIIYDQAVHNLLYAILLKKMIK